MDYDADWFHERSIIELRRYRRLLFSLIASMPACSKREKLEHTLDRCRFELNFKTGETKY
jgi:hypothetical protein